MNYGARGQHEFVADKDWLGYRRREGIAVPCDTAAQAVNERETYL